MFGFKKIMNCLSDNIVSPIQNFIPNNGIFSKIESSVKSFSKKVSDIYRSIVGKSLVYAAKENLAEFTIGVIGQKFGQKALGLTMKNLGQVAGTFSGAAISIALFPITIQGGDYLCKALDIKETAQTDLIKYAVAIGATGVTLYYLPNYLGEILEHYGEVTGLFAGGMIGWVLGGFIGVKLLGSEEKLMGAESFLDLYQTKNVTCIIADYFFPVPGLPLYSHYIVDQTKAALVFNAKSIITQLAPPTSRLNRGELG